MSDVPLYQVLEQGQRLTLTEIIERIQLMYPYYAEGNFRAQAVLFRG